VVAPIAAIGAIAPLSPVSSTAGATGAAGAASSTSGTSFATALGQGFDAVSGAQTTADNLAIQASTGTLTDPAQYTIAATQASMMTELATTLESKAVSAFNTIMDMQA
jgi:flagellar hook-basal body complex protein FliE